MSTLTAHAEAAYHPRQGAMSISRDHAVLDQPLAAGRFTRDRGDALCKPARRFWGLAPGGGHIVNCPECISRAERYGVTLLEVNPYDAARESVPAPAPSPSVPADPSRFRAGSLMRTLAEWMQEDASTPVPGTSDETEAGR